VGLGTGLEQSAVAPSHTWDERSHPAACRPFPLFMYADLCVFIFPLIHFGEVVVGCSHRHVWLAVYDVLGPLYRFS
jgi:hypothetical protein